MLRRGNMGVSFFFFFFFSVFERAPFLFKRDTFLGSPKKRHALLGCVQQKGSQGLGCCAFFRLRCVQALLGLWLLGAEARQCPVKYMGCFETWGLALFLGEPPAPPPKKKGRRNNAETNKWVGCPFGCPLKPPKKRGSLRKRQPHEVIIGCVNVFGLRCGQFGVWDMEQVNLKHGRSPKFPHAHILTGAQTSS